MNVIGDGLATLRSNQIEQFPQVKLSHDDIHSHCSICISNFTKGEIILILPCVHKFHRFCIEPWLSENSTCPTCREKVIVDPGEESSDDENPDVEFRDNADDSIIDISFPGIAHSNTTDEFTSTDMSDENSDVSVEDDLFTDPTVTFEMVSESSDVSITVSDSESGSESDNESLSESQSSSFSGKNSDGSDVMFPSTDTSDDQSEDAWEMSDDGSD